MVASMPLEAGVTGVTTTGTETDSLAADPYGANGLANNLENSDTDTATVNYTVSYANAIDTAIMACPPPCASINNTGDHCDFDRDGVTNGDDLDDDNDGILDIIEYNSILSDEIACINGAIPANYLVLGPSGGTYTVGGNTVDVIVTRDAQVQWQNHVTCFNGIPASEGARSNYFGDYSVYGATGQDASVKYEFSEPVTRVDVLVEALNLGNTIDRATIFINGSNNHSGHTVNISDLPAGIGSCTANPLTNADFNTITGELISVTGTKGVLQFINPNGISEIEMIVPDPTAGSIWVSTVALYDDVACNAVAGDTDIDNDGIPNHLDLDSDGDGCYDSYEAGVIGATNNGSASDSLAIVTTDTTGVGANGFANTLETSGDGIYTGTYNYASAIDAFKNECQDNDGDSIADYADMDDDNDGVLDRDEVPFINTSLSGFFLDSTDATQLQTIAFEPERIIDGNTGTANANGWNFQTFQSSGQSDIFFTLILDSGQTADGFLFFGQVGGGNQESIRDFDLVISDLTGNAIFNTSIRNPTAVGPASIDVSGFSLGEGVYSIKLTVISPHLRVTDSMSPFFGRTDGEIAEVRFTDGGMPLTFSGAAAPVIDLDTDNDGIANHLDLDSDNDGCYDSFEAGVIGATVDGSSTDSLAITTTDTTGVGANGFANHLETTTEGAYNGTYAYVNAIDDAINPCNDRGIIAVNDLDTIPEDMVLLIDILSNDTVTYTQIDTSSIQITATNGMVSIDANGQVTYTPNNDYNGIDTLQYIVCDTTPIPDMLCDTAQIFLNVTPVNDTLSITPTSISTTPEDSIITVCTPFMDIDAGDTFTPNICENPSNGMANVTVVNNEICVTYEPNPNYNGLDSICIQLCDQDGACYSTLVEINVSSVNDAPTLTMVDSIIWMENIPIDSVLIDLLGTDAEDSEGSGLIYSFVGVGANSPDEGDFNIDPNTGEITFAAVPDYENPIDDGTDNVYQIEVQVCDSGSLCDMQIIVITVVDEDEDGDGYTGTDDPDDGDSCMPDNTVSNCCEAEAPTITKD